MNHSFRKQAAAALALLLVTAGACGRKTDPATPDSPRPAAIEEIAVSMRDRVAFLSWPVPLKNIEGKDMGPEAVSEFRIFRAELGPDRRKPHYKLVAVIDMANPAPATVRDGRVFWSDGGLQYNKLYAYRIRPYSGRGVGPYSPEVRAAPLLSLAAPKNVAAEAGDGVVTLAWDPVSTRSDGSVHQGFVGYNIYRGSAAGRQDETPVNHAQGAVRTNAYRDTAVVNDKVYYYRIRAVDSPVRPWMESLDSTEVSASPRDMTPPAPPHGITVVPGVGRVFLTWNENKERDIAGYFVYRSTRRGSGYQRLTTTAVIRTTYSDESVAQGMTYYYTVSAVDASGNESEPSKEYKAYTEKLR